MPPCWEGAAAPVPPVILVLCTHVQFSLLCLSLGPSLLSPPPSLPPARLQLPASTAAFALRARLGYLDPSGLRPLIPLSQTDSLLPLGEQRGPQPLAVVLEPRHCKAPLRGCSSVETHSGQQPCSSPCLQPALPALPTQTSPGRAGGGLAAPQEPQMQRRKRLPKLCVSPPCLTQGHTEAQRSELTCPRSHSRRLDQGQDPTSLSPRAAPCTELVFWVLTLCPSPWLVTGSRLNEARTCHSRSGSL